MVELDTEKFGRWARRSHVVFPVPLNGGHAARVRLGWDELLEVSEDRIEITNAVRRPDPDAPPRVREMLEYAAELLAAPDLGVYAVRADTRGGETLAMGVAAGDRGLVVIDTKSTVTLVRTGATDLAAAVVQAMPSLRGFAIERVEVTDRALAGLQSGVSGHGLARAGRSAARAAGIPEDVAQSLARLQAATTGGGMIGAVRYDADGPALGTGSDWFEGPTGAVLKRDLGGGAFAFEPATRASMTSAAVTAVSTAGSAPGMR